MRFTMTLLMVTALAASSALAQSLTIEGHSMAPGGQSEGGGVSLIGGISPTGASRMSGDGLTLDSGVWPGAEDPKVTKVIFDSTHQRGNGRQIVNPTWWLANKLCLVDRSYNLDSLTLILDTRTLTNRPVVLLRMYTHSTVSDRPLADMGVDFNLHGATNPIQFPTVPTGYTKGFTWKPATPMELEANRCYWVVLSTESGEVLRAVTGALPIPIPLGEAAVLGRSYTQNSGATWTRSDPTTCQMLVRVTDLVPVIPTFDHKVDVATPIPNGVGNFSSLSYAPMLSGDHLVFHGTGSASQAGLYLASRTSPGSVLRIADLSTPIPNGSGSFLSFGSEAGIIIVSGNTAVFPGVGAGGQKGIYAAIMAPPQIGLPFRIVDGSTVIAGGDGKFTDFSDQIDVSGNNVVFEGGNTTGQRGIYAAIMAPPQAPGLPMRIADTSTPIPGGNGTFTGFPQGASVSDDLMAFAGVGGGDQRGVYAAIMAPPQTPVRIADGTTSIPAGQGTFQSFGTQAATVRVARNTVAFVGGGSGGQRGIYGATVRAPGIRAFGTHDEPLTSGPPYRIADLATLIPGGTGTFAGFGALSASDAGVAFVGLDSGGQTGVYHQDGDQLHRIVGVGDLVNGRMVALVDLSSRGLSSTEVAVRVEYVGGGEALISMALPQPALRLSVSGFSGSGLTFSVTTIPGRTYQVEGRTGLEEGVWVDVPGATQTSSGAAIEFNLPIDPAQPSQWYRVRLVP